jgi:hypothetical protein
MAIIPGEIVVLHLHCLVSLKHANAFNKYLVSTYCVQALVRPWDSSLPHTANRLVWQTENK